MITTLDHSSKPAVSPDTSEVVEVVTAGDQSGAEDVVSLKNELEASKKRILVIIGQKYQ